MDEERERFESFCFEHSILINIAEDLKTKIRGYCYYDGEHYNIIVNVKFDTFQLRKTTIHEIIHIMKNHFSCDVKDVEKCEKEVNEIIGRMRLAFA